MAHRHLDISSFRVIGINYKKSDVSSRGQFTVNQNQYLNILKNASNNGINNLFILSTCNRTEVYAFAENVEILSKMLCNETEGTLQEFEHKSYHFNGTDALLHLFQVAAGLDSQILGDYEIVGQIKDAVKFSKKNKGIGAYYERLLNAVMQSTKEIKTKTELSGGTVSVSFATIQYIKSHFKEVADKNFLIVGTGKIGGNTCKNIVDYLHSKNLTLINRSDEKAIKMAEKYGVKYNTINELDTQIQQADVIIIATNAQQPIILKSHFTNSDSKLLIDLSMPCNIEKSVTDFENISLINVDELSKIKDTTIANRISEIPKANAIIDKHFNEFLEWNAMREITPEVVKIKYKLNDFSNIELIQHSCFGVYIVNPTENKEENIQKIINGLLHQIKMDKSKANNILKKFNDSFECQIS